MDRSNPLFEKSTAQRRYYACTDNSIGGAILFDKGKIKNHISESSNLREFSNLDDAEDFVMKRNPDILLRRIENLEEENNKLTVKMEKENLEKTRRIESLKSKIKKLRI